MKLEKNIIHRSQFIPKDYSKDLVGKTISVIQYEDDFEVGRVTWKFVESSYVF